MINMCSTMRRTIGYLTNSASGAVRPYESDVTNAVIRTAIENECDIIHLSDGWLDDPSSIESRHNFMYDVTSHAQLDGILVLSFFFKTVPYPQDFLKFCQRFRDTPILGAGIPIPGIPSIIIDNYGAMRLAIRHLIETHGCKRIVYIDGPEDNLEAQDRKRAYQDLMQENGIILSSDYLIPGNFRHEAGEKAAKIIVEKKLDFDAIVCANDSMAMRAMKYLALHDIHCPKDYAISGFDNREEARMMVPSLTTIEQNTWELGQAAMRLLLDMLNGKEAALITTIPIRLKIRESCGCAQLKSFEQELESGNFPLSGIWPSPEKTTASLVARLPPVTKREYEFLSEKIAVLSAFFPSAQALPDESTFLICLRKLFLDTENAGINLQLWADPLKNLTLVYGQATGDYDKAYKIGKMGSRADYLYQEALNHALRREKIKNEWTDSFIRDFSERLITATSHSHLKDCMDKQFPPLGIEMGAIALLDRESKANEHFELIISYDITKGALLHTPTERYPSSTLYPAFMASENLPAIYSVQTLNYRDERFGIMILRMNTVPGPALEPLRGQISHALKSIANIDRLTQDKDQIEELNTSLNLKFQRLNSLRTIDIAITESKKQEDLLSILLTQITQQLGVDAAAILLYDKNNETLSYASGMGFKTSALKYTRLEWGKGLAGKAAVSGKQLFVKDLSTSNAELLDMPLFMNEGFKTYCAAPLMTHDELIGVLEIFHRTPLKTNDEWRGFLDALAGQAAIALENTTLLESLKGANAALVEAYNATIEGWSRALELRDHETKGHSIRVARQTVTLAEVLGITGDELIHIYRGALLHDIGKVGIPDAILLKPSKLTAEEKKIMYRHPEYARDLLYPIGFLHPALDIPYCHHEKWDGSGYPRGLKAADIPLYARIFTIIDVWDALSTERPYRKAWETDLIVGYMESLAGIQFDPVILPIFLNMRNTNVFKFNTTESTTP